MKLFLITFFSYLLMLFDIKANKLERIHKFRKTKQKTDKPTSDYPVIGYIDPVDYYAPHPNDYYPGGTYTTPLE